MCCKIAVIGESESVLGFSCLGLDVHQAKTTEQAKQVLCNLIENKYSIIYLTDNFYCKLSAVIKEYSNVTYPIITSIPSIYTN